MRTLKKIAKYIKAHKWLAIPLEVTVIVLVLVVFSWFQNRDSLAANKQLAPDFVLQSTDGKTIQLSQLRGKKVLVYFFAPWCNICHLSGGNLNDLRKARTTDELEILVVGLSWSSKEEINQFKKELNLSMPVLIGYDQQMLDYKIKGFPTYFIIDEKGKVTHRSVGYSTELGMRLRT